MQRLIKKKNILYIALWTTVLLSTLALFKYIKNKSVIIENWDFTDEQIAEYGPFWITVPAIENKGLPTDINGISFEDEPDEIYLYFPDYVDRTRIVFYIRDGYDSNYEARRVADFSSGEVKIAGKIIRYIGTSFPMMFICTDDNSMPFSEFKHTDDMEAKCTGKVYFEDIKPYEKMCLKPRGNSTWGGMHKKPYSLVLDRSHNLMGLGNHKSWNLMADAWDKSLLKNYTFNSLAREIGVEYEPNMKHFLLYINGDMEGMYLLTEKVAKVGNNDGEIPLGSEDFLFLWSGVHCEQPVYYNSCEELSEMSYADILYPQEASQDELDKIKMVVQKYVDAMEDEESAELYNLLDVDSFMKFYWVQELSMNFDAYSRSIYTIYRNNTKKMYYAPIWDMDLTLGANVDGIECQTVEGWNVRYKGFYKQLFEHESFTELAKDSYINNNVYEKFLNCIEKYKQERDYILEFGELDYKIWKDEYIGDGGLDYCDTYFEYSNQILELLSERVEWINQEINK